MTGILPTKTFADRVQILIKKLGSQEKLGEACGISGVTIGKYALGKADPSRDRLIAMADAGGVNVLWLATGEGKMERDRARPYKEAEQHAHAGHINDNVHKYRTEAKQPYTWFHEWIDEELQGKSISEVMALAVKIKTVLDENKGG